MGRWGHSTAYTWRSRETGFCLCPFSIQFAPSGCNLLLRDGSFSHQKCRCLEELHGYCK